MYTKVYEYFANIGWFEGKISKLPSATASNSKFTILYSDGKSIVQREAEVRQWLDTTRSSRVEAIGRRGEEGLCLPALAARRHV